MPKEKLSRKELLKGPDEFLTFSEKTYFFAKSHSRFFTAIGILVVGAAALYLVVTMYFGHTNRKGQEAYNNAFYTLSRPLDSEKKDDLLKQSMDLFQKVVADYGRSKVSKLAVPEMAFLNVLENKPDEAIPLYERFLANQDVDSPYGSMARLALAACYEEKKDFDKAISFLQPVAEGRGNYFKDQALLSLSRLYRLSGQEEKSKEVLKTFVETYQDSNFLPIAKAYLNSTS